MEIILYRGAALPYTIPDDNTHRSNCYTTDRCVGNLNDGKKSIQSPFANDWLAKDVTNSNIASKVWVIMDLGISNTDCVGEIGIFNQNEYGNNARQVATFDLLASDSTSSGWTGLLSNAALQACGTSMIRRQTVVSTCVVRRYIKLQAKSVTFCTCMMHHALP